MNMRSLVTLTCLTCLTCLAAAPIVKPCRMVTLAAPVDSHSILAATEEAPPVEPFFAQESFQFDLRSDLPLIKGLLAIHM